MRTVLTFLMLSSFAIAQVGGKAGIGGKGGIGTGVAAGTTVTYASIFCNGTGANCAWNPGNPTAGEGVAIVIWGTTALSITSVCDGTGAGGCTGSSTYHSVCTGLNTPIAGCSALGTYVNGSNYASAIWYTSNYAGSAAQATITVGAGTASYDSGVVMTGQTISGSLDGYGHNQGSTGTALTCSAITPTNGHDLLVGLLTNSTGGGTYTAGTDSQGHAMTLQAESTNVTGAETVNETSVAAFNPTATYASAAWNDECILFK